MKNKIIKASFLPLVLILFQVIVFFITKWLALDVNVIINSKIDNAIPFLPYFIYFYVSWYLLLFIVPFIAFFKDKEVLKEYAILSVVTCILVGITYLVYPTSIIRANFSVNNISSFLVDLMYKIDTPVRNCFPSAHCIYSFLFIYCVAKMKNIDNKYKSILIIISSLIVPTTLFIKQHVFIDVVGAVIYTIVIYFVTKVLLKSKLIKKIKYFEK